MAPEKKASVPREASDRRRTKEGRKSSEVSPLTPGMNQLCRCILENATDVIWAIDLEGKRTFVNNAIKALLGYEIGEVIGHSAFSQVHPGDMVRIKKLFAAAVEQKAGWKNIPVRWVCKDGAVRYFESSAEPVHDALGNLLGFCGIDREITERKQAEEALRESEERFKLAMEATKDGLWDWNVTTNEVHYSSGYAAMLGYATSEVPAHVDFWKELMHPEDREAALKTNTDCIENRCDDFEVEFRMRARNGEWRWILGRGKAVVRDPHGRAVRMVGTNTDITDRKRSEEALKKARDRAQQYLDVAGVMFVAIDTEQRVVMINKKGCEILGYEEHEIVGKNWFDHFIRPEDIEKTKRIFRKVIAGNIEPVEHHENPVITKHGRERIIAWHNAIIRDESGRIVATLSSGEDITERKRAEKALREARDKLEHEVQVRTEELKKANAQLLADQHGLRTLASQLTLAEQRERRRVATEVHDFIAQNLAFTKIKLNELRQSVSPESLQDLEQVIQLVDNSINDTRHLITELGSPVLYELGLVPALESLTQQLRKNFGLSVTFEDDKKPKSVSDDVKVFVFQAARELLTNVAKHAKAAHCTVSLKTAKGKLRLDIVDDGIGFDAHDMETVSAAEKGFGFYSIRERLEPLGGSLGVHSEPNRGTRVTLFAPLMT